MKAFVVLFILTAIGSTSLAESTPTPTPKASPPKGCAKFVQQFYDWYLAKEKALEKDKSEDSAFDVTLRDKQASFAPTLVQALKDDLEASKKSPDDIVGLDFDPFLNSQDTAEKYVVGEVHANGDHYLVDVFGVWEGKKNPKPDVVPELASESGKWIFINFHYGESDTPVNENLVSLLQQLKKDREAPAKQEPSPQG